MHPIFNPETSEERKAVILNHLKEHREAIDNVQRCLSEHPEIDFETADLTPMARSFYGENKRVANTKSRSELGMEYQWPDYRTALTRMWEEGSWR